MNVGSIIEKAFCGSVSTRRVPAGIAVSTQFITDDGDPVEFYVVEHGGKFRLIDDGSTIPLLEAEGVTFRSGGRAKAFADLRDQYGVLFDAAEMELSTDWMTLEDLSAASIRFSTFLLRIGDFRLLHPTVVANTFREDLLRGLTERFGDDASILVNEPPVPALEIYTVDIVVRHKSGRTAAIFPATSEQKALEAVLFAKELELKKIENVTPFLVFESAEASRVSRMTNAKAMNSELLLASWEGGKADVLDKVGKRLAA